MGEEREWEREEVGRGGEGFEWKEREGERRVENECLRRRGRKGRGGVV